MQKLDKLNMWNKWGQTHFIFKSHNIKNSQLYLASLKRQAFRRVCSVVKPCVQPPFLASSSWLRTMSRYRGLSGQKGSMMDCRMAGMMVRASSRGHRLSEPRIDSRPKTWSTNKTKHIESSLKKQWWCQNVSLGQPEWNRCSHWRYIGRFLSFQLLLYLFGFLKCF